MTATMKSLAISTLVLVFALQEARTESKRNRIESEISTSNAVKQDNEINGIVVDHAMTFIGREFYRYFTHAWFNRGAVNNDNLVIREYPTARYGSRIIVEHERRTVFQAFLPPARNNIKATAEIAAQSIAQRLETYQLQKRLFSNPDLADDEI